MNKCPMCIICPVIKVREQMLVHKKIINIKKIIKLKSISTEKKGIHANCIMGVTQITCVFSNERIPTKFHY